MSPRGRALEILIFAATSALGIYALGRGLDGTFERGVGVNLLWLAVVAACVWILFAQMGRVHDAWPRRSRDGDIEVRR